MKKYEKIDFQDQIRDQDTGEIVRKGTPLSCKNLGHMDDALSGIYEEFSNLDATKVPYSNPELPNIKTTGQMLASLNAHAAMLADDQTFDGANIFTKNIIIPSAPTLNTHATNKLYVDTAIAGTFEQGIWTPKIYSGSTLLSAVNIQGAYYAKIGKLVFISAQISFNSKPPSGNGTIIGIPFIPLFETMGLFLTYYLSAPIMYIGYNVFNNKITLYSYSTTNSYSGYLDLSSLKIGDAIGISATYIMK